MKLNNHFRNKKILVTGGSGMIGLSLINRLVSFNCKITICSLDNYKVIKNYIPKKNIKFLKLDLRMKKNCMKVTKNIDYVFHLMGVKSNTQKKYKDITSTFSSFVICNTYMIEAAYKNNIKKFLFVGSIGQYPPLKLRKEEDVWKGLPAANDKYMGITKRTGEILAEAYLKEFNWKAIKIVRLSNVYGPYDKFHPTDSHVIPSLIKRVMDGEFPLKVAGDGSAKRDFIHSDDVVEGIIRALILAPPCYPINIGSGRAVSIRFLAKTILRQSGNKTKIIWKKNRPSGDNIRVLDISRAKKILKFKSQVNLSEGINKTIKWYKENYVK